MTDPVAIDNIKSNSITSDTTIHKPLPVLIRPNTSDNYSNVRRTYLNRVLDANDKIALLMVLIFAKLATATETCFKSKAGNSYTLNCLADQAESIYGQLAKDCGAYTDGHNDCAGFFSKSLNFCSGLFGGAVCTLSYSDSTTPDGCIVNKTQALCQNTYGTAQDFISTIGIGIAALTFLCCCMCIYCRLNLGRSSSNGLGESSRLLLQ